MKPCLEYLELMNAALDGEATDFELARLQAHLEICPACAALYEDLSALRAGSDALVVPAPAGLTDAVLAQIKAESTPKLAVLPKKKKNRWFPMVAAAAVCALVVFGTGSLDRITGGMAEPAAAPAGAPMPAPSSMPVPAPAPMEEVAPKDTEYDYSVTAEAPMQELQDTSTLTEPCTPEEFPIPTVVPALTPEEARGLVLDRIFGELYSEPGNTLTLNTDGNCTYITMENDDGTVEESVVTYTGPSPNRQYHCFTWTWEGQTEEDLDLFRYAVHMTDYYVMWPGQSPLFDEALTE